MTYLEGIPFGKFYYEIAVILRNSLLVSSVLFNSEAWYNVTNAELDLIETVDLMLLRSILKAPISTPKEMLYLELGCLPYREIIRQKRLSYLYYILHDNSESMVYRFFEAQMKNRNSKDWATTIMKDLEELKINISMEEIKKMKKGTFMNTLRLHTNQHALNYLSEKQASHSKVNNWSHSMLKMQKYLKPNMEKIRIEDCQLIFKLRCRVTRAKINMKGLFDTFECRACEINEESQEHIINCEVLRGMNKYDIEVPDYGKLFIGTVKDQLKISKIFKQNMKILEDMT